MGTTDENKDGLLTELARAREKAHCSARWRELAVGGCWWLAIVAIVAASVAGFVPHAVVDIPSWVISLLAATAAGLEWLRYRTFWRDKSNAYYAYRDDIDGLSKRLKYEIATPTADNIASISRQFREAGTRFGERMSKLNALSDAPIKKGSGTGG